LGGWSIPKGEVLAGEDDLTGARRGFEVETGIKPAGKFVSLGKIRQPSGEVVIAWAFEGDGTPAIRSNKFFEGMAAKIRPNAAVSRSGSAEWFSLNDARDRMHRGQNWFPRRAHCAFPLTAHEERGSRSGLLFVACAALNFFVDGVDREGREVVAKY
jgi:predicted NUDIX family NTP pyrophosphohydrolase